MSRSAAYLKQSTNGKYYVHWTEDRVGKRVTTGTASLLEAEGFLAEWILLQRQDYDGRLGASLRFADLWTIYLEKKLRNGPSRRTVESLGKNLLAYFGAKMVVEIDQDAADTYVERRTAGRLGRRVKPHSAGKELRHLIACLHFCSLRRYRQRLFDPALFEGITPPSTNGAVRERWLRPDEITRIFDAAERMRKGPRLTRAERFLRLALETAGRETSIRELTWDRVDFETGVVHLHNPDRPVTSKRSASVPMSKVLRATLERAYVERTGNLVLDHAGKVWDNLQRVFVHAGFGVEKTPKGKSPRTTSISPHTLRHSAATLMARRGVPIWTIARILGNSVAQVERVYAKWVPGEMRAAVDVISSFQVAAE